MRFLAVLLFAACVPAATPLSDTPHVVSVSDHWTLATGAEQPTDVLATAHEIWVLDGYRGRMLRFDLERSPLDPWGSEDWGRPVRFTPAAAGGLWLVAPDHPALRRVDSAGAVVEELVVGGAVTDHRFSPVAALDLGEVVVVAVQAGQVLWLDPGTGAVLEQTERDVDDIELGSVTDLAPGPDGSVLATDAFAHRVHLLEPSGTAVGAVGAFGMWNGTLNTPKAAQLLDDRTLLVADSRLDVVQLFDARGPALGMLADGEEPIRFEHAIALARTATEPPTWLILDSGTGALHGMTIAPGAVQQARDRAGTRAIRLQLADTEGALDGVTEETCRQCHDGLVNDDREVWDPAMGHHPVDVVPERELPAFFPLDEGGAMRCITCHSPHGVISLEEAQAVETREDAVQLVRHRAPDEAFTRLTREDSALCVACHGADAHAEAREEGAGAHQSGAALLESLAEKLGATAARPDEGCLACHAPHGATDKALIRRGTDERVCLPCHEEQEPKASNHPIGPQPRSLVKVRASAELPVARGGATCRSCHDLVGGTEEALLRTPADGGLLCLACHDKRRDVDAGKHARVQGRHGLACLGCHDLHGGSVSRSMQRGRPLRGDPAGCRSCHDSGRTRPGQQGHPVDGQEHDGAEPLTCGTCHEAHDPTAGELAACGRCHDEQAEAKARGGHGQTACIDCHPVHERTQLARVPGVNPLANRCLACHAEGADSGDTPRIEAFEHEVPVFKADGTRWTPLGTLPLFSPTGEKVPADVNGELTCPSCHLTHGPDPKKPGDNLRIPGWEPTCSACHGADSLPLYQYYHKPERWKGIGGGAP